APRYIVDVRQKDARIPVMARRGSLLVLSHHAPSELHPPAACLQGAILWLPSQRGSSTCCFPAETECHESVVSSSLCRFVGLGGPVLQQQRPCPRYLLPSPPFPCQGNKRWAGRRSNRTA